MKNIKSVVSLVLILTLVMQLVWVTLPQPRAAKAAFTASDFLKTDGKFIKKNSGTGDIVTLRGTNLGGWLSFEDWMSPLGEFAFDRAGWSASASVNSAAAGNAIDGDNTTRWTPSVNQANGQWFQINMGSMNFFNKIYVNAAGFTGDYPRGYQ
ncbi:MAG TPA: discoidin domain-containing protein, partial [Bacilli bacterium]